MIEQPHPDRVRLLPWSVSPVVVDAVLVTVIVAATVLRERFEADYDANPVIEAAALLTAVAAVLGRRRFPIPSLALALLAIAPVTIATEQPSIVMPAALIALYHVGTVKRWSVTAAAGAATVVIFASVVVALLERGRIESGALAAVAWPAFAVAAGAAVRAGRDNLAAAQDRAARAESSRELEARRRVSEERLRIARDVHDLVAHHLAVVNVQAGVAGHLLRTDPDAAQQALDTVRTSASTGVTELGQLLSVLRTPEESDGPTEPTPDLEAVDDLVSSFSASGLRITHNTSGAPRPLSETAQVAAYRVVQEALTNAHKHGDGTVVLDQRFDPDGLEIIVSNRVGLGPDDERDQSNDAGSGYGLVGMRERVEANGGELTVDSTDGRFIVRVLLPAEAST